MYSTNTFQTVGSDYRRTSISLVNGMFVDIAEPDPVALNMIAITEHLAKLARFNGATYGEIWSVAQHSILVESLLPETADNRLKLYGLVHDFHEALIGDLATPVKTALDELGGLTAWNAIAARCDLAIWQALGIGPPGEAEVKAIKAADRTACAIEWRQFMTAAPPRDLGEAPVHGSLRVLPWPIAQEKLLDRLKYHIRFFGLKGPGLEILIDAMEMADEAEE